jgi:hypothetical protein
MLEMSLCVMRGLWAGIAESVDVVELPAVNQAFLGIAWEKARLYCLSAVHALDQQLREGAITPEPYAQAKEMHWDSVDTPFVEKAKLGECKAVSVCAVLDWKLWHMDIRVKALNIFNALNAAGGCNAERIRFACSHDNKDMLRTGSHLTSAFRLLEPVNCGTSC